MKPGADLLTCRTNTCRHVQNLLFLKLNSTILLVNTRAKHEQPTSLHTELFSWHGRNFPQAAGTESFCAPQLSRSESSNMHFTADGVCALSMFSASQLFYEWKKEHDEHISGFISVALYTYQVSLVFSLSLFSFPSQPYFQLHASLSRKLECLDFEIIYVGLELHLYIYVVCRCNKVIQREFSW